MLDKQQFHNALPIGYILDKYEIINVLGIGGFGIAYLAKHMSLDNMVVIKEYFPSQFSSRIPTTYHVHPKDPENIKNYQYGLKIFLNEAKIIEEFDHPNIVRVRDYFEKNNTAYIVMYYILGATLAELAEGETASEEEIYSIIIPLLKGLEELHKRGYMHRDIKPSNIYIHNDTRRPILIDFGAAKYSLGVQSKSISSVVSLGYSPYEQYSADGNLGPWSDIYALGCVVYRLISGSIPIESSQRIMDLFNNEKDPLIAAKKIGKQNYSTRLLNTIDHAIAVREKDRPQSATEWLTEIQEAKNNFEGLNPSLSSSDKSNLTKKLTVIAITTLLLIGYIFLNKIDIPDKQYLNIKNNDKKEPLSVVEKNKRIQEKNKKLQRYKYIYTKGYLSFINKKFKKTAKGTKEYCHLYSLLSVRQHTINNNKNCKLKEKAVHKNRWSYEKELQYDWCLTAWVFISKGEAKHRENKLKNCLK